MPAQGHQRCSCLDSICPHRIGQQTRFGAATDAKTGRHCCTMINEQAMYPQSTCKAQHTKADTTPNSLELRTLPHINPLLHTMVLRHCQMPAAHTSAV